jgi:hypothetical protein
MDINQTIVQLEGILKCLKNFKGYAEETQIVYVGPAVKGTHHILFDGSSGVYSQPNPSWGWVAATYVPKDDYIPAKVISIKANKIDAIKALRTYCEKAFGVPSGLKDSKDFVEALIPFQEIPELKEKLKALGETRAREILADVFKPNY